MARISGLPAPAIIFSLKGTLDYVAWRGIFYVRSWPRRPRMPRSLPSQATAQAFANFARAASRTAIPVQQQGTNAVAGTLWTWRDAVTRGQYGRLISWE